MAGWKLAVVPGLIDTTTGALVGFQVDGKEYLVPTSGAFAATQPFSGALVDGSAVPGNVTISASRGRAAFALGAATCVVTNTIVTTASQILAVVETADATLTFIKSVVPGSGSFTVTANATATATTKFSFLVLN